jgi:hypothetical protein
VNNASNEPPAPDGVLSGGVWDSGSANNQEEPAMNLITPFRSVQRYVGKIKTLRDQIRTERFMNSLSEQTRKDIGWPDRYTGRWDN